MTNDATNPVEVIEADMALANVIGLRLKRTLAKQGIAADLEIIALPELLAEWRAGLERNTTSRATDKKLAEALRPFAAEADNYDCVDDEGNFVPDYNDAPDESALNEINDLTVGDLRRARRILTSLEGQG